MMRFKQGEGLSKVFLASIWDFSVVIYINKIEINKINKDD